MGLVNFTNEEEDLILDWAKGLIKVEEASEAKSDNYPLLKSIVTNIEGQYGTKRYSL